jgi:hypothetical protein
MVVVVMAWITREELACLEAVVTWGVERRMRFTD